MRISRNLLPISPKGHFCTLRQSADNGHIVHTPAARWFKLSRILQLLVSFEEQRSKLISRRQYYNAAPVIIMAGRSVQSCSRAKLKTCSSVDDQ